MPWIARGGASTVSCQSDSESEAGSIHDGSVPGLGSLSRTSSSARLKRSFSQASDCSELGSPEGSFSSFSAVDSPGPEGKEASGTWPRLPKRSSRTGLYGDPNAFDVWELTRSLAREKSDLADQLARLTAEADAQQQQQRQQQQGVDGVDVYLSAAPSAAEGGGSGADGGDEDEAMEGGGRASRASLKQLDELVAVEQRQLAAAQRQWCRRG